jgi:hypothetical protein
VQKKIAVYRQTGQAVASPAITVDDGLSADWGRPASEAADEEKDRHR